MAMTPSDPAVDPATGPAFSFGLFADSHYAEKVYGNRHCRDSLDKLRDCIADFNARNLPMAVNLGDSIDAVADKAMELRFLAAVREVTATFHGERVTVLGNHDLVTLTKEEFLRLYGAREPAYHSFDRQGFHFVVLDGNCRQDGSDFTPGNFHWDDAWISEAQMAWLARDMEIHRNMPVIVFTHENLDDRLWNDLPDPHLVRNAPAVRRIFERHGNVRAVFQGHHHDGPCATLRGIPYIGSAAMVVGPGRENNAYAVVSLESDGAITVEGFGRHRTLRIAAPSRDA
ncbi:MAG: metallophosphoesterase [Lentisphaerae bacterium]|nr:metallophosphoesterase [Lentisphaerota bacterium]